MTITIESDLQDNFSESITESSSIFDTKEEAEEKYMSLLPDNRIKL